MRTKLRILAAGAALMGVVGAGGCDVIWGVHAARRYVPDGGTGAGGTTSSTTGGGGTGGEGACAQGASVPCYSGPPGTEGVGICKAGSKVCGSDGTYGPCTGEVLPQLENCATSGDEDCNGMTQPCQGTLLWAKRFGDTNDQTVTRVTTDHDGNVILAGSFSGHLNFGGGSLASAGDYDVFVAKLGPGGAHVWSKSYGDASTQTAGGVAVDSMGNVLVAGQFSGTVDFGGKSLTTGGSVNADVFITKLSPEGDHLWSFGFGDASAQFATGVAVDAAGNVFVTGSFSGTLDFSGGDGGAAALTAVTETDMYLVKLDAAGNHLWSQRFGVVGENYATGVAVDGDGNVFMTGFFMGTLDFGGTTFMNNAETPFLAKFDTNGNHQWSTSFQGPQGGEVGGVAINGTGKAILAGGFTGTVDFGTATLTTQGGDDIFLGSFGEGGSDQWVSRFGDMNIGQFGQGVATGKNGNIAMAGRFTGAADFGGGQLASAGGFDAFLAKFDAKGKHQWSKRFGDTADQKAHSVALDPSDNVFVTGVFTGAVDFGSGVSFSAVGGYDIFLAKFSP